VEITFEVEETIILRQAARLSSRFCRQCGAVVEMISPQTIADLSDLTEREIFRLVETGKIHFIEAGRILICLNSIAVLEGEFKENEKRII
jgi:hypothetical protein